MFRILFFLFLVGACANSFAQGTSKLDIALQKAISQKLYQAKPWLNLVHYKKNIFGNYISESDGPLFFVSKDGKKNPEAELLETIKGFFSDKKRNLGPDQPEQTVRCQFPARWLWLSQQLGLFEQDVSHQPCAEFEKFKARAQTDSVTLVFASFNVGNPSSTFGHSLMRLNKKTVNGKASSPLLDLGVNYAANPTTSNPLMYALFGMVGVFPGTFAAMPYFYKVREYSDFDSRDLWEYNLNLSSQEMQMLVAHLWEMGFTHFDYYFFSENCSYHMLSLLDVAAPRLNLLERTSYWVIPTDTIKTVAATEGLLRNIVFRPSLNRQLNARLKKLKDPNEMKIYKEIVKDFDLQKIPKEISEDRKAEILDAAIDHFDSEFFSELVHHDPETKSKKENLLIQRSRLPMTEEIQIVPDDSDQPHLSHGSSRTSFTHLHSTDSNSRFEISHRFALHDFLDPQDGYPGFAKIEFFKFTMDGSYNKSDFNLRQFDFMSVESLQPVTAFKTPLSWKGRFSVERVNDDRCQNCLAGMGEAGAGLTFLGFKKTSFYFMALSDFRTSPNFNKHKWTAEAGPLLGVRSVFNPKLIFLTELSKQWILGFDNPVTHLSARMRWAPHINWSFEAGYREELKTNEYLGSVYYYF